MLREGIEKGPTGAEKVDQGITNAFKHGFFSALNTNSVGPEYAKVLGDAHEVGRGPSERMDLHNNERGRSVGVSNPSASPSTLVEALLLEAMHGRLAVMSSSGNVMSIRLTANQVHSIQNVISHMKQGEKGNTKSNN